MQSDNLINWLASGERGISSDAMVTHLTGIDASALWGLDHPHDPADFYRCRKLLRDVPELAPELPRMATCSPVWAALVEHWQELCDLMDAEAPDWERGYGCRAENTYARMQELISTSGAQF